jgi:hypothetical protein
LTEPPQTRLDYAWNYFFTTGEKVTGYDAGRRGNARFNWRTARIDVYCINCGAGPIKAGTKHWAGHGTYNHLCDDCAGGPPQDQPQSKQEQKELLQAVGVDEQDAEDMIATWNALEEATGTQ